MPVLFAYTLVFHPTYHDTFRSHIHIMYFQCILYTVNLSSQETIMRFITFEIFPYYTVHRQYSALFTPTT